MAHTADNVRQWIEHKAPEYDPAWAWKKAMEKYTSPPASERLEKRKHNFLCFMNKFLEDYQDKNAKVVRFDGSTTWEEVQEEATAAFDEYAHQGRSWRHPFRSSGRLFGVVACRIEFLIQLIPRGDYLGILCAGLTLVYNAARRKKGIRGLIIRVLDSLSEHIEGSKSYIRMYAWNEDIRQKTEDLYIAILEAVEAITNWLRHPIGESFKCFIQQGDYGKDLEEKLTVNIQDKANAFSGAVSSALHAIVHTIHHNVLAVAQNVEKIDGGAASVGRGVDEVRGDVTRGFSAVNDSIEALGLRALSSLEEYFYGLSKDVESIIIPQFMQPAITIPQLLGLLSQQPPGSSDNPFEQTLERIRVERDFVLFLGRSLSPRRQASISFVMQNSQFQQWFKSMNSQTLVIHSMDLDFGPSEIVSPLSYMCAMLSQATAIHSHSYPLAFFCRLHIDPEDKARGAKGMLRSLTAQVLVALAHTQQHPDLSFLGYVELQAIQAQDLPSMCRLFEELLKRIGTGVILCILDGSSWFECQYYAPDMHMVMQFFNSLVEAIERSHSGLIFKILLTNALMSQYSRDWFPSGMELYTPASGVMEGMTFNSLAMLIEQ
ncbi:uncharacterized protein TRIVIDRAFT_150826 [Trichoderma virens Gv29-8]|uniref:Uncharacterized protein n=1 Tax=Hypocrea virens (strain Gv29-8 / FGSC 10586) TaxID=413071 RepID=G9MTH1_HYPVG|nr:uncharacterized protein TRIVIDRAFT_150826 [Trichoderma virens Gv29-8]EHK23157.1 hypothetical protein TRIVIDRAFT_150826 [Trichoderma virens Gv29-8]UKZ48217.1 hypothetical protein TrVGV298_002453 [Trichoderma virens]